MRVIRTELYLDQDEIEWPDNVVRPPLPGIATAWFKSDAPLGPRAPKLPNVRILWEDVQATHLADENWPLLEEFMHRLLLGGLYDKHLLGGETADLRNRDLIRNLLNEPIIIEQSPPADIPLGQILSRASSATIGTYLGVTIAGANPLLMFATVPAGIIVVGSALGIAKGLEAGLYKSVERLTGGTPRSSARRRKR